MVEIRSRKHLKYWRLRDNVIPCNYRRFQVAYENEKQNAIMCAFQVRIKIDGFS